MRGHYEGDSQRYRADAAPPVDPLAVARALLEEEGTAPGELDRMEQAAEGQLAAWNVRKQCKYGVSA